MYKKIIFSFFLFVSVSSQAQILGGGTSFSNAATFDQAWISGCPGGGTQFSNQAAFEPTTTMDPCAPAPACATGTTGSDVWFSFFARSTTATIAVNPSASFDVAIQAFSGTACPGLTDIGCVDLGGNNVSETLNLSGLTVNTRYYFRVFGANNSVANRTGTYTFCGSAGLGSSAVLPVEIISFNAVAQNSKVILNWATASEANNSYFQIESSVDGNQYQSIGRVSGVGTTSQTTRYSFTDIAPFTATNFYRLKQVDIDGRFKYSAILTIKLNSELTKAVSIFPNPVADKINIRISSDVAANSDLKLISNLGQIVFRQTNRVVKGDNLIFIYNVDNLPKGMYTLHVTINNEELVTKVLKN